MQLANECVCLGEKGAVLAPNINISGDKDFQNNIIIQCEGHNRGKKQWREWDEHDWLWMFEESFSE